MSPFVADTLRRKEANTDAARREKEEIRTLAAAIDGWLPDFEGELLYDLARNATGRGVIVEIGSWKGKSTIWLARGAKAGPRRTVYAIDPHTGSPEHRMEGSVATFAEFKQNIARAGVPDIVIPILKPSEEAADVIAEPVELIFIDGAHEYERVRADFQAWFPKVIDGGVMAFHDTLGWQGPRRLVEESVYRSPSFRRVHLVGSITFGEKTNAATLGDRLRNRYVLALKQIFETGRAIRAPAAVRRLGRRLVERLQ